MKTIDANILTILKTSAAIDGNRVRLTCGQLDRKTYQAVNEVLERLGGTWVGRKTAAHVFSDDPRPLLEECIYTGRMPDKNVLAYFPTPPAIVAQMIAQVTIGVGDAVLEPSAGEGAICDGVRAVQPEATIRAVEIDPRRAAILQAKGYAVDACDFLSWSSLQSYEAALMNPPFVVAGDPLAYIAHIEKAHTHLAPWGKLIAIAPPSFTFRSDKRSTAFRAFVERYGQWIELPEDSFSASGTDVNTVLIVLNAGNRP